MKAIGFTGTSESVTPAQLLTLRSLATIFYKEGYRDFSHGDCIGADAIAHEVFYSMGYNITIHPPSNGKKRALCKGKGVTILPPRPYMERNQNIVDQSDVLIGAPKDTKEVIRSGTWATIRRARKRKMMILIIWPDGMVSYEGEP